MRAFRREKSNENRKKLYVGFLINKIYVMNFEVFHWNILLSINFLFLKSFMYVCTYRKKMEPQGTLSNHAYVGRCYG